jgi:hypothetical protein
MLGVLELRNLGREGTAVLSDGYAPLFSSLTTGTLCGRWPDIGLWPIVLSLADRNGVVDVTPAYISSVTGLALPDVIACMARFCEPDPYSRSAAEQGSRLTLVSEHRDWGWKVVNHGFYRERARLLAKREREVASGANAARMADRRSPPESADIGDRPPGTAADPLSDQTRPNQTKQKIGDGERAARAQTARRLPDGFELTEGRKEIARKEGADPEREFAKFSDHWLAASGSNARKHDWDAAWRNWCRKAADFSPRRSTAGDEQTTITWRPPDDEHA